MPIPINLISSKLPNSFHTFRYSIDQEIINKRKPKFEYKICCLYAYEKKSTTVAVA